jgi:hypothetical protein
MAMRSIVERMVRREDRRRRRVRRPPRLDAARCASRAERRQSLARCAGVHVDFHAHRHFDDLRGFPGHFRALQVKAGARLAPSGKLGPSQTRRKQAGIPADFAAGHAGGVSALRWIRRFEPAGKIRHCSVRHFPVSTAQRTNQQTRSLQLSLAQECNRNFISDGPDRVPLTRLPVCHIAAEAPI